MAMFGVTANQSDYNASASSDPSHDWFCFHCHRPGGTCKRCANCFRVYHESCLPGHLQSADLFTCPVCSISQTAPVGLNGILITQQLEKILHWAHTKTGPAFSSLSGPNASSSSQFRIGRPIDLSVMRTKLKSGQYGSPQLFLADFQLLAHNVAIFYGAESSQAQVANDLLKQVEQDMASLERSCLAVDPSSNPSTSKVTESDKLNVSVKKEKSRKSKPEMIVKDPLVGAKRLKKSTELHNGALCCSESDDSHMVTSSCENDSVRSIAVQTQESSDSVWPQSSVSESAACDCSSRHRKVVVEMQQEWLDQHKISSETALVDLAEQLQAEFDSNQEKLRKEMLAQFKQEMESTKNDLDQKYTAKLQQETQRQLEKHKTQMSETKKKQWCWACESEAIYHCCWNSSYCSVECQQRHWPQHRKYCRRKKH